MRLKPGFGIVIGCLILTVVVIPVTADMIPPRISYVYFDRDGTPFNETVQYTVTCFGYPWDYSHSPPAPGSYQPKPVFRYSANCSGYGCPVYEQAYLQYTHVDWCDLEGVADNTNFTIGNFSTNPFSWCNYVSGRASRTFGGRQKYYYATPEYVSCRYFEQKTESRWTAHSFNFSRLYNMSRYTFVLQLPGRDILYRNGSSQTVSMNRSDIDMDLVGYIAYLETCRVNADPACPGWIADGTPLKSFSRYRTLKKNATHMNAHPCDAFLLEADPSLILPFRDSTLLGHSCYSNDDDSAPCYLTELICESRFTIPSKNTLHIPGIGIAGVTLAPGRSMPPQRSPVGLLFCSILSSFNISCDTI